MSEDDVKNDPEHIYEKVHAKFNEYREQIRSIITGFVRGLIEENKYIYEVERNIW